MDRVAYKPLSSEPANAREDREEEEEDDDDGEDDNCRSELFSKYQPDTYFGSLLPRYCANFFGLKQLRNVLFFVAIVLTVIFLAVLSFRVSATRPTKIVDTSHGIRSLNNVGIESKLTDELPALSSSMVTTKNTSSSKPRPETRPKYSNYMGSIVRDSGSTELNQDDLHYPPVELSTRQQQQPQPQDTSSNDTYQKGNTTIWWTTSMRSNYVTVTDYIRANKSFNANSSLTLTTQATIEFLYHTLELCKRWDGPISLAVFVPGSEFQVATTLVKFMRQCLPAPLSACMRDKVSWHFVYGKAHGPVPSSLGFPKDHLDIEHFPLFVEQDQCPKLAGPNPEDLIRQFEEELRKRNDLFSRNYRQQFQLTYPINVLRNTARLAASTKYVLASDIELYPSINLVPSFINYINKHNIKQEYPYIDKFIFTLPIFEVKATKSAPKTKRELVNSMQQGDAIFFHKWVCDACQNFPNRLEWLETDKFGVENYQQSDDEISIFKVTQRDRQKNSWEPIFIGTNEDPLYDDRLTWDGRRDKMGQMYEMCLKDYHLFILGNAFLVHAPGIKHIDKNDTMKRLDFMRKNNHIYDKTMENLKKQYANSGNIDKC